jgi:GTP cyclohydrolase I
MVKCWWRRILPFILPANITYYPSLGGHILPISQVEPWWVFTKMNRVVDYFAKRPQVQERLTMQIVEELQRVLGTEDVACVIDAKHLCVNSRGIRDIDSSTVTSEFGGKFKDPQTRREFLDYINLDTEF